MIQIECKMLPNPQGPQAPVNAPKQASGISIAGLKDLYHVPDVDKALHELSPNASEALRGMYEKMLRLGGQRFTAKPSAMPQLDQLCKEMPNFSGVIEDIRKQLSLCLDSRDPIELQPMMLLGEPGIGKTHFARRISQLLGTGFGFLPMCSMTAGWVLSGASSQWKNAKPGKVFDTLLNGEYANPVMVVDEIDKVSGDGQYDPLGALYSLLEAGTAMKFVDEFVEVPIDASSVVWFATANTVGRIPAPILNRVNVYEIDAPDPDGSAQIARGIYREIRNAHDWGRQFPEEPDAGVIERLATLTPREMRRATLSGFGNAKIAGRSEVSPDDVRDKPAPKRSRIGF